MSTPYDSTTRHLFKLDEQAWLKALNIDADTVERINVDMSSIAGAADIAVKIGKENCEIIQVELQKKYEKDVIERSLFYSVVLSRQNDGIPVRSFIILLCPQADGPNMRCPLYRDHSNGTVRYLAFHFEVIRLWELSTEALFAGGLAVLPLAFIADIKKEQLPDLVRRADERIRNEATSGKAKDLWAAVETLLTVKYEGDFIMELLGYARLVKDSPSYKEGEKEGIAIGVERGRIEEARAILLRQGTTKFGAPDPISLVTLNAINSLDRFEDLANRILIVGSWRELLA